MCHSAPAFHSTHTYTTAHTRTCGVCRADTAAIITVQPDEQWLPLIAVAILAGPCTALTQGITGPQSEAGALTEKRGMWEHEGRQGYNNNHKQPQQQERRGGVGPTPLKRPAAPTW
jgi:hypothetical protein